MTIPRMRTIAGEFPIRSFFSGSTGSDKFYSMLPRFAKEANLHVTGPAIQITDVIARKILFIAPIQ
jgi:hypothetical protein